MRHAVLVLILCGPVLAGPTPLADVASPRPLDPPPAPPQGWQPMPQVPPESPPPLVPLPPALIPAAVTVGLAAWMRRRDGRAARRVDGLRGTPLSRRTRKRARSA